MRREKTITQFRQIRALVKNSNKIILSVDYNYEWQYKTASSPTGVAGGFGFEGREFDVEIDSTTGTLKITKMSEREVR